MSNSNQHTTCVKGVINQLLKTTPSINLYHLFIELTEGLSDEFKKTIAKELLRPYRELYFDNLSYISPDEIPIPDTFEINESLKQSLQQPQEIDLDDAVFLYNTDSSKGWSSTQQLQINQILSLYNLNKPIVNSSSVFPTFTTSSKITTEQLQLLFNKLVELDIIRENNSVLFINCFTQKTINSQPQINFYQSPQILYHLFKLMSDYDIVINTDKSHIFSQNRLFVDIKGNPFKTPLRKGLDSLKEFPKNKVQRELVEKLTQFFKQTF